MTEESKEKSADIQGEDDLSEEHRKIVQEKRSQYRKIAFWYDEDFGLVIITKPGRENYRKYVNQLQEEGVDKALEMEQFALSCTVYPSREDAKQIYKEYGPFAMKVAGRAQKLGGAGVKELGKP